MKSLVNLYKSHILSYVDAGVAAYYHASTSVLASLDSVQSRFLKELLLSEKDALLLHNLAPPQSRRDISCLGVIHRTVIGEGPPHFKSMFAYTSEVLHTHDTRYSSSLHNKQLFDPCDGNHTAFLSRSIFGLVHVYNTLPQNVVDSKTVNIFQQKLQNILKQNARSDMVNWANTFNRRNP